MAAVLVYIDLARDADRSSHPNASSLQALAAGRLVASSWGATLYAAVIIQDVSQRPAPDSTGRITITSHLPKVERQLAQAGADKVVVAVTDAAVEPLWGNLGSTWSGVLDHLRPRLVLFGADAPSTAELGPRTAARIGARLLQRARASENPSERDFIELRDRDGAYVRATDSGAAVALIGAASATPSCDATVDVITLLLAHGTDPRIDVVGETPAEVSQTTGVLVALGDDALDPDIVRGAQRLAELLGAQLIGGPAAARAGAIADAAVFDRSTPLAPELCVVLGTLGLDLAGSTSIIRVGSNSTKSVEGALPGPIADGLHELVQLMERL